MYRNLQAWGLAALFGAAGVASLPQPAWSQSTAVQQPPLATTPLPEAPELVVEGALDGVGSQGSAVSGQTVVTSASLTPTRLADTGSSLTVITEEQIRQRGQTSVAEILRGIPGVDVVRQSSPGSITSVFIRGAGNEHTKVLIDGIPANDPINTTRFYDFANLSVDNIERIEVLRGPQSVLYGSDAIGGVINITTKRGQGRNTGRVSASGGAFSTGTGSFSTSGSLGGAYYSFGGSYFDTNGFSSASIAYPGNTEPDGFQLGTLSSRVGWQPTENINIDWVVRHNHGHVDIDKGGGPNRDDPNDNNTISQTVTGVRLSARNPGQWLESSVAYYVSDVKRGINSPGEAGNPFAFTGVFYGVTQQIDYRTTLHVLDNDVIGNSITAGALYQTEVGSSSTVFDAGGFLFPSTFPKTSLDDGAVYGQEQLRLFDNWFTTVGVRSDHYNLYGANDTYRATTLYRLPALQTAFRGSIGTAFRAPSLFQRFDPFSGNANLQPEDAKGWDVGVEQPILDGLLVPSVTYFRNDFTNFIFFDFNANQGNGGYVNLQSVRTSGVELSTLAVLTDQANFTVSYTHTNAKDLSQGSPDFGQQLLRRPYNKIGMTYDWRFWDDRANWFFGVNYVGERFDAVGFPTTRVILQPYFVCNTALQFNLTRNLQLFGRIDNLFNEKYEEVSGFATAPASGYAGMSLMW